MRTLVSASKSIASQTRIYVLTSTLIEEEPWINEELCVNVIQSFIQKDKNHSKLRDVSGEIGCVNVLHVQHEYNVFDVMIKDINNGICRGVREDVREDTGEYLAKKTIINCTLYCITYFNRYFTQSHKKN